MAAPDRSSFDVLAELFGKDVDLDLIRRGLARTPTERLKWLEEMQAFAESAAEARRREAERVPATSLSRFSRRSRIR